MGEAIEDAQRRDEIWTEARGELRRAYLAVGFGRFDEALEACERARELIDGEHHLPATIRGSVLAAKGDLRGAIGALREVTRRFPEATLPRLHFAEACYLAGRERQADRALEAARRLGVDEHAEFLDALEATWSDVEPSEVPPPVQID